MTRDLTALRAQMRRRRRALSTLERTRAAEAVAGLVARHLRAGRGTRIAAYLSFGAELDTGPLLDLARRRGWQVYVPAVVSARRGGMRFVPLRGELRRNRFGIFEPRTRSGGIDPGWIDPRWLDIAFLPLLAAGPAGERLGSGAGFYDRAFAYRRLRRAWRKPALIGLGHEFQRVASLPRAPWDIPLDALVTERAFHRFASVRT